MVIHSPVAPHNHFRHATSSLMKVHSDPESVHCVEHLHSRGHNGQATSYSLWGPRTSGWGATPLPRLTESPASAMSLGCWHSIVTWLDWPQLPQQGLKTIRRGYSSEPLPPATLALLMTMLATYPASPSELHRAHFPPASSLTPEPSLSGNGRVRR